MISENLTMAVVAYQKRVHDLLSDGYQILFSHITETMYVCKLWHRNGKRVFIKLTLKDGILSQSTNGKECYSAKVC